MTRLIGILFLAAGPAAIGLLASEGLKRQVSILEALLGAVERMKGELPLRLLPGPELLQSMEKSSTPPVSEFFRRCGAGLGELGEKSFAQIWRQAMEKSLPELEQAAKVAFETLGEMLGQYREEEQLAALERTTAELERALDAARREAEVRGKLDRVLGLTAGAFLAIVLI